MNTRDRVVYIDGAMGDGRIEREVLDARGYDLELAGCMTSEEIVEAVGDAPAVLNAWVYMGADVFERLPGLKVVVRGGVGYDNIDVDAATKAGVVVCNVLHYGTNEVANHAFALLLALNRKVVRLDRAVREGVLAPAPKVMPHTGRLAGETLGLLSYGSIAQAMARRAAAFGMRVIAFDPFVDQAAVAGSGVELVDLPVLLAQSDYVSVHTPLSSATRGLIGEAELAMMKPSAYVVVTSRGGVVDEDALHRALVAGRLAGAGLDVWEVEPPRTDHPLLQLDNVVGSMHMAWYSEAADVERRTGHAEAAADVLDGRQPASVVNPDVLSRVTLASRRRDGVDDGGVVAF